MKMLSTGAARKDAAQKIMIMGLLQKIDQKKLALNARKKIGLLACDGPPCVQMPDGPPGCNGCMCYNCTHMPNCWPVPGNCSCTACATPCSP